jgi:hypothetical protein
MNKIYSLKNKKSLFLFVFLFFIFIAVSCKKTSHTESKVTKPLYQSTGKEGKITGTINFVGNAPMQGKIDMNADAACVAKNPNATLEILKVKDGKLANVIVFIKDGTTADGKAFSDLGFQIPETEVKLDQIGCVYSPRVLGIQTNQKLGVYNSDETVHTTQAMSEKNRSWHTTQQINSAPVIKTFNQPEVIIPFKCTQHGWMAAYLAVFDHPFFAVTKEDGVFEIKGVPPGNYTLVAWHEKGKEKSINIRVEENGQVKTDFSYEESSTQIAAGSLVFAPALELPMPSCK